MKVIEGKNRIQEYFKRELIRERKKLFRRYRKNKVNLFTALIWLINYEVRPNPISDNEYTHFFMAEDMTRFRSFIPILDEFLEWGASRTRDINREEISKWSKILITKFLPLGFKRRTLENAIDYKTEGVELIDGRFVDTYYKAFQEAHVDWYNKSNPDEDWVEYYYTHSKKFSNRILERVDADLNTHCDITMENLTIFLLSVRNEIENHLKRVPDLRRITMPFISFERENLLKSMGPKISRERAERWLEKMEYQPGGNINRAPFLKLSVADFGLRYIPIIAVFYPFESFEGAWTYHATKAAKRSTAFGTMGLDWGLTFERYVREKLARIHPNLHVFPGSTKISPIDYPEVKSCFDKIDRERIEIDIIAYDESKSYVISCKAPDMVHGPEMFREIFYVKHTEIIKNIDKNLEAAKEIRNYAECISNCTTFLEEKNLNGMIIEPILVTSTLAPLANEKIRLWLSKTRPIPEVRILQSNQLF